MAVEKDLQPTGVESTQTAESSNPPEGDKPQVSPEQFAQMQEQVKKLQSAKDKEVATLHKQYQEKLALLQSEVQNRESALESVLPEDAKAEYQRRRMEAELTQYRQADEVRNAREFLSREFDVPLDVLEGTSSPEEVSARAFQFMKQQRDELLAKTAQPAKSAEQEKVEKAKESGAVDTTFQRTSRADVDAGAVPDKERLTELKKQAEKGGRAATSARLEYMKLLRQKQSGGGGRAKV